MRRRHVIFDGDVDAQVEEKFRHASARELARQDERKPDVCFHVSENGHQRGFDESVERRDI